MSEVINILFLGGAKRVSFAECLIESGWKQREQINIYSYELSGEVPIASVGEVIIGKKWKDETLYDDLSALISRKNIKIVLPFVDQAIEVASRLKEIRKDVFIPSSPVDTCRIMFDKKLANDWFVSHRIPVPEFYTIENVKFPVILKPRYGSASKGIVIAKHTEALKAVASPDDYLLQDYIEENEEYTVDCYVSQSGAIISIVPRIRLEVLGGEAMNTKTVRDKELIDLSERILLTGAFRGPVTIQYIRDKRTGATYVMEINPRLGGGVIASIAAEADIPSFLLAEAAGKQLSPVTDWKENTLMTRYYKEVIFYADNH